MAHKWQDPVQCTYPLMLTSKALEVFTSKAYDNRVFTLHLTA